MLPPFRAGLGGVVGSGKQYLSWIALDDLVAVIQFALATEQLSGPVNAVTPSAVTNYEFTKVLGKVLGRPTIFPMPAFAARMAFGEMADEMLLGGVRVEPRALTTSGFPFAYPQLEPAYDICFRSESLCKDFTKRLWLDPGACPPLSR